MQILEAFCTQTIVKFAFKHSNAWYQVKNDSRGTCSRKKEEKKISGGRKNASIYGD